MAIYKRGETYWIDINLNGRRVRRSAGTADRKAAQELHDTLRANLWRQIQLGEKPKRSFDEAALRWLKEKAHKRSISDDAQRITFWRERFKGMTLDQITRQVVTDIMDALQTRHGQDASNGTKNRYIAVLRSMLRAAEREWEWLERAPAFKTYAEPKRRVAYFTQDQARQLLAALPVAYQAPTLFALNTGLRRANVFGLHWSQVDLDKRTAWIHPDEAKAGQMIMVPLNDDALAILRAQKGRHASRVFGEIDKIPHATWRRALKRAGLNEEMRFHDLRHTWASWHAMAGTPMSTLQELGGWHSAEMVRRYAHLAPEHLARAAQNVGFGAGTFPSQDPDAGQHSEGKVLKNHGVADGTRTHDNRNHNAQLYCEESDT